MSPLVRPTSMIFLHHLIRYLDASTPLLNVPKVIMAIQAVLNHLPFAALNEELRRILCRLTETTTTWKIIHACTSYPYAVEDPIGWELVARFAAALGTMVRVSLH